MSKEPELKARDKVVVRMTREGAVEENLTAGTEQRVSKRLEDAELVKPAETAEPSEALAEKMEEVQEVLRKAMEKDKLSILTGVYTGGGERIWVYYTRTVRVFGERLNEALAPFEMLPISIYTEVDPEWEEYLDMYEMKEWAIE